MAYVSLPITSDFQDLVDDAVAYMTTASDGRWVVDRGAVEVWLIEAFCRAIERVLRQTAEVPDLAFTTFGTQTVQLPVQGGLPASTTSTWKVREAAGFSGSGGLTIAAGTLVALGVDQQLFVVLEDVLIPQGATGTADGEVQLQAVIPGTRANGIPAGTALQVQPDSQIISVVTTATTAGGEDPETDGAYRDRLAAYLRLIGEAAITPADFATFAVVFILQVGRATAIADYDPDTDDDDAPGHMYLVITDPDGQPVDPAGKLVVQAFFDDSAVRIVNTVVHLADADYVPVPVDYIALAADDADPVEVKAAADLALYAALDPGTFKATDVDGHWPADTIVGYFELGDVLRNVAGLKQLVSLTIDGLQADFDLAAGGALAPLPAAVVTGTVT